MLPVACVADDKADDSQRVQVGQDYIARLGSVRFQPGTEVRRFLDVPEGATWAEMTLRAGNHDTPRYQALGFRLAALSKCWFLLFTKLRCKAYISSSVHTS